MGIREYLSKNVLLKKLYHKTLQYTPQRIMFRRNIKKVEQFDLLNGTDFGGRLYQDELGIMRERANDYSPSPLSELVSILKKSKLTPNDNVCDMGCGKGYAMYIISQFDIGKVGGVELSQTLCEKAIHNLSLLKVGIPWEVCCSDAGSWNGYDEYNVFYIYNSFPKVVMEEVKNRIDDSFERYPRLIRVWYLFPEFPDVFLNDISWSLISKGSFLKLRHGMHVFIKQ